MTRDIVIKCPVCLGKCKDEHGVECKPCAGKGILWGKETDHAVPVCPPPMMPFWYPVPTIQPQPQFPWDGFTWSSTSLAIGKDNAGPQFYTNS